MALADPWTVIPDTLDLRPGELVEVRSLAEIRTTLETGDRRRGLAFLPDMQIYCGRRFRVFKRVERMFLEESKQRRKLKNTVLLEAVMCDGSAVGGCDRSCFFYWREAWLKRVDASGSAADDLN